MLADTTTWQVWDAAPVEWYLIYLTGLFLGILIVYVLWEKWGEPHDPEDKDQD
jgi:hypothetical protein